MHFKKCKSYPGLRAAKPGPSRSKQTMNNLKTMVHYRCNFLPGASYFLTLTLLSRASFSLVDRIAILRSVFWAVRTQWPFILDAVVFLRDHLHNIWTLPSGDAVCPGRWRAIKTLCSRQIYAGECRYTSRANNGEHRIWQRQYRKHALYNERDSTRHVNPIKHAPVSCAVQWPCSSLHRFVPQSLSPVDWRVGEAADGGFGE